ncbi:MAG: acetate kinase [Endomicrobium sp.]|jgi:acetate kinase|nr:acetate kinase [Endomicrobium sp.]
MKILSVNCGSSSVKYSLFEMKNEKKIAWGVVECIGLREACYVKQTINSKETKNSLRIANHTEALKLIIESLLDKENGSISDISEICVVGHRIVHGGNKFSKAVLVTEKMKRELKECFALAPLHNPAHYAGIIAVEKMLPKIPSVLVFDTAFHQTIPDYAYMYAIPYEYYKKDHIRKYGFHGSSHKYVSQIAATMLGKSLNKLKLIIAHLGNGSSITAVKKGKVIDTSMGFTPLQGVVMGTRCGDIDPAIICYILNKYPQQYKDANSLSSLMNNESGLLGVSGVSSDVRTILKMIRMGNKRSKLAFEMLCYSVKKYIGSYHGILNGIDGLIFTAGIGENSPIVRKLICKNLHALGIEIDTNKNNTYSNEQKFISTPESRVKVMVIPTNEELMIAREAKICFQSAH